jgi:hypothetical protein
MGMGHNIELFKPVPDKGYAIMEKMMRSALLWATKREPVSLTPLQAELNPTGKPYSRYSRGDRILFRATSSADAPSLDVAGRWSGRPPFSWFRDLFLHRPAEIREGYPGEITGPKIHNGPGAAGQSRPGRGLENFLYCLPNLCMIE